jgi:AmmeMemoRadiSam system protein A
MRRLKSLTRLLPRQVNGSMKQVPTHPRDLEPEEAEEPSSRGSRIGRLAQGALRKLALDSIRHGLENGNPLEPDLDRFDEVLKAPGAVFVTLNLHGHLRGCVGSFEASRPLLQDVARNAYSAAFMDFRFPPVSERELSEIEVHISLLTPLEPFEVANREDLLKRLRPGVDGLLLDDPPHRSTFLPQVWESLKDPEDFLGELLMKAGLPRDHWSSTIRFQRYGVEEF